ncbi:hypothetical protein F2Q69_00052933 [Brassica cretica]|uniref:Uncharacterized protein n=1 Tax=Brassica cretica TaxID=69181 RepID=A0A8S9N275_BRACR|nr:hypothetical protein F2Q69_00052933 [Brassica cretica]
MPRSRPGLPNEERILSLAQGALQKRSNSSSYSTFHVFFFKNQEGNDREKAKRRRHFSRNLSMRMSKCKGCEEVTSLLIGMRNYYLLIEHKPSETYPDQLRIGPSMTIGTRTNQARSLRNYRTCTLSVLLVRYVATERPFLSVASSDRAFPKRRYDISLCILVYPLMLSPEDRSEPISCFPPF